MGCLTPRTQTETITKRYLTITTDTEERTGRMTDAALLDRARQGDQQAFRELVERYEAMVASTVTGMLGPGSEAEDVGQETFIRFYKALDKYRGEASLGTYLNRIAINLSLNAIKRRRRRRLRFVPANPDSRPEPATHDAPPEAMDYDQLIQWALQELDPDFRAVVVLRLVDGYSTREAAGLLDIPEGTVLSRLYRAQQKLRTLLSPYVKDHE